MKKRRSKFNLEWKHIRQRDRRTRVILKDPQIVSFLGGSDDKKIKEEERSIDLKEKPRPFP